MSPEAINEHYQNLLDKGISKKKINSQVQLLGSSPKTINRNIRYINEIEGDVNKMINALGLKNKFWEKIYLFIEEKINISDACNCKIFTGNTVKTKAKIDYLRSINYNFENKPYVLMRPLENLMSKYGKETKDSAKIKAEQINAEYKEKYTKFYEQQGKNLEFVITLLENLAN